MRMHPLVTVKKAASVLGVEKSAIREKLVSGEMKGEVRRVGNKDKWFVYSGELDFLIERQRIPELEARAERLSLEGLNTFFEKTTDTVSAEELAGRIAETEVSFSSGQPEMSPEQPLELSFELSQELSMKSDRSISGAELLPFEKIMDVISRQFSLRLAQEHAKSQELKELLEEQQSLTASIPVLTEQLQSQLKISEELKEGLDALRTEMDQLKSNKKTGWFARLFGSP